MTFDAMTFIFQVVNFIVLTAVLWKILWVPLRRHMQERADRFARSLEEIDAGRKEIADRDAQTRSLHNEAAQAKSAALAQATIAAESLKTSIIEEARQAAIGERDRILAQAAGDQQRREQEFLRSLAPLVGRVVERLIQTLRGPALHDLACERFAEWIDLLPAAELASMRKMAGESAPIVVAANGVVPSRLLESLQSLGVADGAAAVRVDPELIAGVQLRFGENVFDGSVRAQIVALTDETSKPR